MIFGQRYNENSLRHHKYEKKITREVVTLKKDKLNYKDYYTDIEDYEELKIYFENCKDMLSMVRYTMQNSQHQDKEYEPMLDIWNDQVYILGQLHMVLFYK